MSNIWGIKKKCFFFFFYLFHNLNILKNCFNLKMCICSEIKLLNNIKILHNHINNMMNDTFKIKSNSIFKYIQNIILPITHD
jgi:hypothetical protein